jgi:MFS family permease
MTDTGTPGGTWQSVRGLPEFRRLLELRAVSQFGDGLFQAGLAGALLFSTERAVHPWEIAMSFAVLFLPYSALAPFAGALLDRWDRRLVLIGAQRRPAGVDARRRRGAGDEPRTAWCCCFGALIVNGFTRFVSSGLSAALPHLVPREQC